MPLNCSLHVYPTGVILPGRPYGNRADRMVTVCCVHVRRGSAGSEYLRLYYVQPVSCYPGTNG